MKKAILILLLLIIVCLSSCGNRNWGPEIGNRLSYNCAIIQFAGKVTYDGPIDSWKDHEDGTVDIWFPKTAPYSKGLFSNMNVILYNKN